MTPGDPTFLLMAMPVAGMGTSVASCCGVPPVAPVIRGNPTFLVPMPVAAATCNTAHGGMIPMGDPTHITL